VTKPLSDNPNRYEPEAPPEGGGVEELRAYLSRELARVSAIVNMLADGMSEVVHAPPTKLVNGMVRNADGTNWNPGAGRGMYRYDTSVPGWVKLG
jgi:hypothetical protein